MHSRRKSSIAIAVSLSFGLCQSALGNTQYSPAQDWEKRQNIEERLRSYGPDLLGESIDPHTGGITFEHTDLSIPGNFDLEVSLRRRRTQGPLYHESVEAEFADWSYVVPRVYVVNVHD